MLGSRKERRKLERRRDQLTVGYFNNFDIGSLKKIEKKIKIEKNL
jgi:hypothetical protein